MKILQLKPHYFRSFCDNSSITFAERLSIFYGGNGAGKSSLAESLEWLFYGYTKRRRKGDQFSKNEYKGSYINSCCPPGEVPFVEADVILNNGKHHVLRRSMKTDERGRIVDSESVVTVDRVEVSDFSIIGVTSESYCPIVVQHGIQDFIHTRPIDRYRIISEALGLSDLTKFKDALEQAKNRFKNNPPQKVIDARAALKRLIKALEMIGCKNIAIKWQKGDIDAFADNQAIFDRAREITGSQADTLKDLINDVRNRQALEISKLFNVVPFQPSPNIVDVIKQIESQVEKIEYKYGCILGKAGDLANSIAVRYSQLQITFWKQGLLLLSQTPGNIDKSEGQNVCPFCEETVLTVEKLEDLKVRAKNQGGIEEKRELLNNEIKEAEALIVQLDSILTGLDFATVSQDDVNLLKKMFNRGEKRLDQFAVLNNSCTKLVKRLKEQASAMRVLFHQLQSKNITPENALKSIENVEGLITGLKNIQTELLIAVPDYVRVFSEFQPILQRELSDEQTVAVFSSVLDLLTTKPQIDLVILAREFEASILRCQQIAEEYILRQQRTILGSREKEILDWYSRLSPNPDVRFSGLEPGKNEFNLRATAFGRELNAAASLSQSQLNCLGLSVYIPSIVSPNAPFQFIVFDDPVQAMDDDHHEAFLIKVVPELVDILQRQVIVLTHLKPTADRLRSLYYHYCPVYYKLDKLSAEGPKIREYIPLKDEAKHIKELSEGNDACRVLSVDRLRVLCEVIMRETHLKVIGTTVPENLKQPRQILQAFRKLTGVTPAIVQQIDDTIGWSDPSHHTDPDWQVPDSSAIKLHLDRLSSVISSLGLQKD